MSRVCEPTLESPSLNIQGNGNTFCLAISYTSNPIAYKELPTWPSQYPLPNGSRQGLFSQAQRAFSVAPFISKTDWQFLRFFCTQYKQQLLVQSLAEVNVLAIAPLHFICLMGAFCFHRLLTATNTLGMYRDRDIAMLPTHMHLAFLQSSNILIQKLKPLSTRERERERLA